MAYASTCDNMLHPQGAHAQRPMLGSAETRYRCCDAKSVDSGAGSLRSVGMAQMATLTLSGCSSCETTPPRSAWLRLLDTLAEWQMRHSHSVISRVQTDAAVISNVTQPSSANERSSTKP
jgi:hypothetical protein